MSQPEPDPSACSSDRKAPGGGAKKMSCNGCRVLRKGCSDNCVLRQCLQWIDSPQSQAAATVFVAKFFGRAGLMAFIEAVSEAERPALFKSLLYESCGRTVSPVHGAVGLMCTGKWHICQAAVQTVLSGGVPECMTVDEDADQWQRLRQIYDLRRVRQKTEQQLVPPNGAHHEVDEEVRIRHQEKLQTQTSVKLDLSLKCDSQSNLHHERASSPASASANSDNSVNKEAAAAAADSQPCAVPEDVEAVTVLAYCQSSELNHRSQVPKQKRL